MIMKVLEAALEQMSSFQNTDWYSWLRACLQAVAFIQAALMLT